MLRALLVIVLVAVASVASAQELPTCGDAPSDTEVRARLAFLSAQIRREEPPVRRWWSSFALLHGVMGSAAGILAASAQDEGFRNEMLVGLTSSTLALTTILVFIPPLMGAGDNLRGMREDTPEARLAKLRAAESIFQRSAANMDFFWGWFPATLSSLYVAAAAGTLLLAFNRPTGAIIHSIGGAVLGLGRLLLHPTGGRSVWRRYRRVYPDAACTQPASASIPMRVAVVPHGIGLGLRVDF